MNTYYLQYLLSTGYVTNIDDNIKGFPPLSIWGNDELSQIRINVYSNMLYTMPMNNINDWYYAHQIIQEMTQLGLMLYPDSIIRIWILRKYLI